MLSTRTQQITLNSDREYVLNSKDIPPLNQTTSILDGEKEIAKITHKESGIAIECYTENQVNIFGKIECEALHVKAKHSVCLDLETDCKKIHYQARSLVSFKPMTCDELTVNVEETCSFQEGEITVNKAFALTAKQVEQNAEMTVHGKSSIQAELIVSKQNMSLHQTESIQVTDWHFSDACNYLFHVEKDKEVDINHCHIHADANVIFHDGNFHFQKVTSSGHLTIHDSKTHCDNVFLLKKGSTLTASHSQLDVGMLIANGRVVLDESSCESFRKNARVHSILGEFILEKSFFNTDADILVKPDATMRINGIRYDDSAKSLHAKQVIVQGKMSLQDAVVTSEEFIYTGQSFSADHSEWDAVHEFNFEALLPETVQIFHSKLNGNVTHFTGEVTLDHSSVTTRHDFLILMNSVIRGSDNHISAGNFRCDGLLQLTRTHFLIDRDMTINHPVIIEGGEEYAMTVGGNFHLAATVKATINIKMVITRNTEIQGHFVQSEECSITVSETFKTTPLASVNVIKSRVKAKTVEHSGLIHSEDSLFQTEEVFTATRYSKITGTTLTVTAEKMDTDADVHLKKFKVSGEEFNNTGNVDTCEFDIRCNYRATHSGTLTTDLAEVVAPLWFNRGSMTVNKQYTTHTLVEEPGDLTAKGGIDRHYLLTLGYKDYFYHLNPIQVITTALQDPAKLFPFIKFHTENYLKKEVLNTFSLLMATYYLIQHVWADQAKIRESYARYCEENNITDSNVASHLLDYLYHLPRHEYLSFFWEVKRLQKEMRDDYAMLPSREAIEKAWENAPTAEAAWKATRENAQHFHQESWMLLSKMKMHFSHKTSWENFKNFFEKIPASDLYHFFLSNVKFFLPQQNEEGLVNGETGQSVLGHSTSQHFVRFDHTMDAAIYQHQYAYYRMFQGVRAAFEGEYEGQAMLDCGTTYAGHRQLKYEDVHYYNAETYVQDGGKSVGKKMTSENSAFHEKNTDYDYETSISLDENSRLELENGKVKTKTLNNDGSIVGSAEVNVDHLKNSKKINLHDSTIRAEDLILATGSTTEICHGVVSGRTLTAGEKSESLMESAEQQRSSGQAVYVPAEEHKNPPTHLIADNSKFLLDEEIFLDPNVKMDSRGETTLKSDTVMDFSTTTIQGKHKLDANHGYHYGRFTGNTVDYTGRDVEFFGSSDVRTAEFTANSKEQFTRNRNYRVSEKMTVAVGEDSGFNRVTPDDVWRNIDSTFRAVDDVRGELQSTAPLSISSKRSLDLYSPITAPTSTIQSSRNITNYASHSASQSMHFQADGNFTHADGNLNAPTVTIDADSVQVDKDMTGSASLDINTRNGDLTVRAPIQSSEHIKITQENPEAHLHVLSSVNGLNRGSIQGGDGAIHNGVGLELDVGHVNLQGNALLSAKGNVEGTASSLIATTPEVIKSSQVTVRSGKSTLQKLVHMRRVTRKTSEEVFGASISSETGSIQIHTTGDIVGKSLTVTAPVAKNLIANGSMTMESTVTHRSTKRVQPGNPGKYYSSKRQGAAPTQFSGGGNTSLKAISPMNLTGISVDGPENNKGNFSCQSDTAIILDRTKLETEKRERTLETKIFVNGFEVSHKLMRLFEKKNISKTEWMKSWKELLVHEPLVELINDCMNSENTYETLVKSWNAGIEGLEAVNALAKCINEESINPLRARHGFDSLKVTTQTTEHVRHMRQQTLAANERVNQNTISITAPSVSIRGGIEWHADDKFLLSADTVEGAPSKLSWRDVTRSYSLDLGMDAATRFSVGVGFNRESHHGQHYFSPTLTTDGVMIYDVNHFSGTVRCAADEHTGRINTLSLESVPDTVKMSNQHFSVNSSGDVSVYQGSGSARNIADGAAYFAGRDASSLYIGDATLTGSKLELPHATIGHVTSHRVRNLGQHYSGFGFSTNVREMRANFSSESPSDSSQENVFTKATVTINQKNVTKQQHSVVTGATMQSVAGHLNTTDRHSLETTKKQSFNSGVTLPFTNARKLEHAKTNLLEASQKIIDYLMPSQERSPEENARLCEIAAQELNEKIRELSENADDSTSFDSSPLTQSEPEDKPAIEGEKNKKPTVRDLINRGLEASSYNALLQADTTSDLDMSELDTLDRLTCNIASLAGDMPVIVATGKAIEVISKLCKFAPWGWAVTVVGGAAIFAVPALISEANRAYNQYKKDHPDSSFSFKEFLKEHGKTLLKEFGHAALVGATVSVAGKAGATLLGRVLKKGPNIVTPHLTKAQVVAEKAAETAAMGTAPDLWSGELPTMQSMGDAALLMGATNTAMGGGRFFKRSVEYCRNQATYYPLPKSTTLERRKRVYQQYFYNDIPFYADSPESLAKGKKVMEELLTGDSEHLEFSKARIQNGIEAAKTGDSIIAFSNRKSVERGKNTGGWTGTHKNPRGKGYISYIEVAVKGSDVAAISRSIHEFFHLGDINTFGNNKPFFPADEDSSACLGIARIVDQANKPEQTAIVNVHNQTNAEACDTLMNMPEQHGCLEAEIGPFLAQAYAADPQRVKEIAPNQIEFFKSTDIDVNANTGRMPINHILENILPSLTKAQRETAATVLTLSLQEKGLHFNLFNNEQSARSSYSFRHRVIDEIRENQTALLKAAQANDMNALKETGKKLAENVYKKVTEANALPPLHIPNPHTESLEDEKPSSSQSLSAGRS